MSNQNINISSNNVSGKCDLKCAYNFKYLESNSTATNNGVFIRLSYDNNSVPPVTYNNQRYNVSHIQIVSPSIHIFNNSFANAEIIIVHEPINGGSPLHVSIPIISSVDSSTASNLITEIINIVSTNAPRRGDSTNLNINGFTLQDIVPEEPFYAYNSSNNTSFIVFDILYAIPLSSSTLNTLRRIIQPYRLPTAGNRLFLNSSGPNVTSNNNNSGIYISCRPTGSSDEDTKVIYHKNTTNFDFSNIMENSVVRTGIKIILACIIFIIALSLIYYLYNILITGSTKLPKLSEIKSVITSKT
jgi:hypothetical protein